MHLEKTTILLEKINNLHKTLLKDPNNISSIEKDLLKDYVKALYQAILDSPQKASIATPNEPKINRGRPILREPSGDQPEGGDAVETPIAAAPEKTEYKPPRIIELSKEIKEEIASTPPPTQLEEVRHEAPDIQTDDELSELFEDDPTTADLSNRLANTPIKDLTKAISINEKIFTVNELFDGNMVDFEQTLKRLNSLSDFSNASSVVLLEKAKEYDWLEKKRIKKAKNFIKLIRRRYL